MAFCATDRVEPAGDVADARLGLRAAHGGQLSRAGGVVQPLPRGDEDDVAGVVVGGLGLLEDRVARDVVRIGVGGLVRVEADVLLRLPAEAVVDGLGELLRACRPAA